MFLWFLTLGILLRENFARIIWWTMLTFIVFRNEFSWIGILMLILLAICTYNYIYIWKQIHIDHVESVHVLKKSSENHLDPKNSTENYIVDQSESNFLSYADYWNGYSTRKQQLHFRNCFWHQEVGWVLLPVTHIATWLQSMV